MQQRTSRFVGMAATALVAIAAVAIGIRARGGGSLPVPGSGSALRPSTQTRIHVPEHIPPPPKFPASPDYGEISVDVDLGSVTIAT